MVDWKGALGRGCDFPRFVALGGLIKDSAREGSVLDVGCADCLLREHLPGLEYTGLDYSDAAFPDDRSGLIHADANTWQTAERFDAVIFNESLYYLQCPQSSLERFVSFVKPGGVLAVSVYRRGWRSPNAAAIRKARAFMPSPLWDISLTSGGLSYDLIMARV